jgi:hypothetical protein
MTAPTLVTETSREAGMAEAVLTAVRSLQDAVARAAGAGLLVQLSVMEVRTITQSAPMPLLSCNVWKSLP